jgi:two-component sensor histidine kinase
MGDDRMQVENGSDRSHGSAVVEAQSVEPEVAALRRQLDEERRQAREASQQQAFLLAELQRRVRNTSALVRSAFERTIETGESLEEVESHFSGRLSVLTRYQLPLVFEAAGHVDLQCLIRDELQEFTFGEHDGITIEGPDVHLPPNQVQALALAIHELVTNALKFGALSIDKAALRVSWSLSGDHIELTWSETGVPVVSSAPLHSGFGREFIEEALPYQIGAITSFELRPGGVQCRISLPLAPPPARSALFY